MKGTPMSEPENAPTPEVPVSAVNSLNAVN